MLNTYEQKHKDESDTKKILVVIVMIAALMFCTTGATFAYLSLEATNDNEIEGTIASASLTLTVTQATLKTTNTGVIVPQLESALNTAMSTTNQCVDGNGNIVCKAYTITITNGSTAAVKVKGTIQFTELPTVSIPTTTTNLRWKRVNSANTVGSLSTTTIPAAAAVTASTSTIDLTSGNSCTTTNNVDSDGCTQVSLAANGGTTTYYIVVWLNEVNVAQDDSGDFAATIHFESQNGTGITSTIRS